jgi:hypothetical protein
LATAHVPENPAPVAQQGDHADRRLVIESGD